MIFGNEAPVKKTNMTKFLTRLLASLVGFFLLPLSALSMQKDASGAYDFEHASCRGEPYEIRIIVTNIKKAEGLIVVDLYKNNPDTFLSSKGRVAQSKYAAKKGVANFCITAPGPDQYAIGLYHDKNANGELDKGALGIPSEYWGVSLDTKKRYKAPPIEKTLFDLTEDGYNLTIKLRKR